MFVRAYRNSKTGKVAFLAVHFDGPWQDLVTGQLADLQQIGRSLFADLEFLDWKTGRSRYNENGQMIQ